MSEHPSNETLQAYLDGELSIREGRKFESHLKSCTNCAAELAQLRSLFHSIESLPPEPLEIDLAPGVVESVRPRIPSLVIGELLVAAIFTVGLVFWLGSSELQNRLGDAAQLADAQLEALVATASSTVTDVLNQIPETPHLDVVEIGDLIRSALVSPSVLWAVVIAALALWLLGNGLVLRIGKDRNA
jgi:anti-sigma factor RsiW